MEGVSEFALRLWMSLTSAPKVAMTPFLRVTPTYPAAGVPPRFAPEFWLLSGHLHYELRPQLMAASADDFIRTAEQFLKVSPTIELNCGCPAPCSVGSGAGSSLLKDPEQFGRMLGKIVTALGPQKLAVKMRTGFQDESTFKQLLQVIPGTQIARLTIHGRTRAQRYTGKARWDLIADAARVYPGLAVVGSGDIVDLDSWRARLQLAPQTHAVLIGRGALRNPWIFSALTAKPAKQELSMRTLQLALATQTLLHELEMTATAALYHLVKEGTFAEPCFFSEEKWQAVYEKLSVALFGNVVVPEELQVSRIALGRLKMQWSSMRSSLPDPYFEPLLLRSSTAGDLLRALAALRRDHFLTLAHNSSYDWLYAGEKKPLH
jgi:tRNA-dihydrouridine synthase C